MTHTVLLLLKYKYAILFPMACLEGAIVGLAAGFLVYNGTLHIVPTFIILLLGDFVPDTIYYFIGRMGDHEKIIIKYGEKFKFVKGGLGAVQNLWKVHPRKLIIFAKVTFGMSIPFLLSAGLFKIPYRRFISYTIPVTLIQCSIVLGLGYFLGKSYDVATNYIRYGYLFVSIIFIIIFIGYILFVRHYSKKEMEKIKKDGDL